MVRRLRIMAEGCDVSKALKIDQSYLRAWSHNCDPPEAAEQPLPNKRVFYIETHGRSRQDRLAFPDAGLDARGCRAVAQAPALLLNLTATH